MNYVKERRWDLGFGPWLFKPGESQRINVQPKCHFLVEKVLSGKHNIDARLLKVFINGEDILGLNEDSIDLNCNEIPITTDKWCHPALPIEVEIVNMSKHERMIYLTIIGIARV